LKSYSLEENMIFIFFADTFFVTVVVRPKMSGLGSDKAEDLVTMKCNLMLLKEMGIRK
jgi:hypothetical protein